MDLLLEKMVRSALTEREEEQLDGILPKDAGGALFVVKTGQMETEALTELKQRMKQGLDRFGHSVMFPVYEEGVVCAGLIFMHPAVVSEEEVLIRVAEVIQGASPEDAAYGISGLYDSLYNSVEAAWQQALSALRQSFYETQRGYIWQEGMTKEYAGEILRILVEKEQQLVNTVCDGDHQTVREGVAFVFSYLPKENRPDPNRLKELFVLLGMRVVNLLQKKGRIAEYQEPITVFTQEIMEAVNMEMLQEAVEDLFLMLNDIARQGTEDDDTIRLALRYLEQHFTEEITLTDVAERFFFTASYFSIFFKKGTGRTFSQYVKELRMERACELLRDTNKKVSEISEETGYADSAYFGKVFKKHVGCSPEEFRKRNYRV